MIARKRSHHLFMHLLPSSAQLQLQLWLSLAVILTSPHYIGVWGKICLCFSYVPSSWPPWKLDQGSLVMYLPTMKLSTSLGSPRMRAVWWGTVDRLLGQTKSENLAMSKGPMLPIIIARLPQYCLPKSLSTAPHDHLASRSWRIDMIPWPKIPSKAPYQYMIPHLQAALFRGKPSEVL